MSNSKWHRLFHAIHSADLALPKCFFKFLRNDHVYREHTPRIDDLTIDSARDRFICGPFYLRDIEWIEWPARYEVARGLSDEFRFRHQDLATLEGVIESAGKFEKELDSDRLRLYAYRQT